MASKKVKVDFTGVESFNTASEGQHVAKIATAEIRESQGGNDMISVAFEVTKGQDKGARTYLEGMANYGIHMAKMKKTVIKDDVEKEVVRYVGQLGANSYYWTKLQIDPDIKVPEAIVNPTYDKIMKIINGA